MRKPNYHNLEKIESKNDIYEGKSIEREIEDAATNNTPIAATAEIIYTARKDGVLPEFDIRADRHQIMQDAMEKMAKAYTDKRNEIINPKKEEQQDKQGGQENEA